MDSVTQAALGAAVGIAVMGRTRPVWQAALSGAVIGTLPDLDVFIDKGDPVRDMVLHRAETHALAYQALAAPLVAGLLALFSGTLHLYLRWLLMVVLGLFTHSLLDAMTVYGTRIGLPFTDHPFGLGSLFIIDPLFTLPLLLGLLLSGLFSGPFRRRWNSVGLVLATLYAGWSVAAQAHVTSLVVQAPEAQGLDTSQILVTPTPFNTLLWRVVLVTQEDYLEGFYSLLDERVAGQSAIRFDRFERGAALETRTGEFVSANLIREFSKGFYRLADDGRRITITDLRMGQHPYFAFSFAFAEHQSEPLRAIEPVRYAQRIPIGEGIAWLRQRVQGTPLPPPR